MEYGITSSAMLAALHLSMWTPSKFDKKASRKTAEDNNVTEKALRLNKNLFPFECASYAAVASAYREARDTFNTESLPWLDNGTRIITATNFMEFNRRMKEREKLIDMVLPEFFDRWPFLKSQSRTALNGLWREEDFPDLAQLRERFKFELKFYPIPDAADFRVELPAEAIETIKAQISQDTKASVAKAMEEPYRRLYDGVAHMAARLSAAKTCPCSKCKGKEYKTDTFNDSLIDNLVDMCDVLPRLNLTADPFLEDYIEQVKTGLTQFAPELVRESEPLKKTLAERAAAIEQDLAGWMNAS